MLRPRGKQVAAPLYVENVFSAYNYTGNAANRSIVNGQDLATKGGMTMIKQRTSGVGPAAVYDTARGARKALTPTSTAAELTATAGQELTAFNSDGFSLGSADSNYFTNQSGNLYGSWSFCENAKFFTKTTKSHTNGGASTVDLSSLGAVGMVIVKRTDSAGEWYVWHRSLTAGNNLRFHTTAAQSSTNAHLSVSGTTLTIASGMATGTYIVYAWAHDTATDGIIQCGSYTGNGSASGPSVTLGWEPQFLLLKTITSGTTGDWYLFDTARGLGLSSDAALLPNISSGESSSEYISPTATGFTVKTTDPNINNNAFVVAYIAIRKGLMRPPTDATKVFAINALTGNGAARSITAGSITQGVDLMFSKGRGNTREGRFYDRLRGPLKELITSSTAVEASITNTVTAFNMDGVSLGSGLDVNENSSTFIEYFLKEARGYFDKVAYTGTGSAHTEAHNLGVVPELMIVKRLSGGTGNWAVYYGDPTDYILLNSTAATVDDDTYWNDTAPTASVFSLKTNTDVNASSSNYTAYLFVTLAGVSKIGTYTGTGTTKQVDCGFAAGARFVLIKRVDSTGDWYFWDTTRGIVSGNDPYLLMNSTAAEATATDYIDPYSAGFELSSTAPAALNALGGTFLFLAIA